MIKISGFLFAGLVFSSLAACKDEPKPAPATATTPPTAAAVTPKAAAAKPDKLHKKSLPAAAQPRPVPEDWTELSDDTRGFSFSVPKGSTGSGQDKGGVGVYLGVLPPAQAKIGLMVVAYKDAKKTLDELETQSSDLISKVFEEANVKKGATKDISNDYRLTEFTSEDAKTKDKSHWKALQATDVTDNYIMIVGSPESEFKINEPTIDEIWGSFDMFSGGASGDSK